MKTLPTKTTAAQSNTAVNWQGKYNALAEENAKLKQQVSTSGSHLRDAEATERNLRAVTDFIEDMTPAQGIVTCANLYNHQWFEKDADPEYARKICALLVARYSGVSVLAESVYALWSKNGTKIA